jgi:hypothetical protein
VTSKSETFIAGSANCSRSRSLAARAMLWLCSAETAEESKLEEEVEECGGGGGGGSGEDSAAASGTRFAQEGSTSTSRAQRRGARKVARWTAKLSLLIAFNCVAFCRMGG